MYILGINGWNKRGHDASACLIKDEKSLDDCEALINEMYAIRLGIPKIKISSNGY